MLKYVIHGGKPLNGSVLISGAKNAAVGILPATLLVKGVCRIENVPDISDIRLLLQILGQMGAAIRRISPNILEIDCTRARDSVASSELVRRIRASYYLIGAQLGRFGHATVALPGGCNFGPRPIDQHIKGFEAIGADISIQGGYVVAKAPESVSAVTGVLARAVRNAASSGSPTSPARMEAKKPSVSFSEGIAPSSAIRFSSIFLSIPGMASSEISLKLYSAVSPLLQIFTQKPRSVRFPSSRIFVPVFDTL